MLITWSCPNCLLTHITDLRDGSNNILCNHCKWRWYLKMTCYESVRKQATKIEEHEHETKIVPIPTTEM